MWTHFFDMATGGEKKEDFELLCVELPKEEAEKWFYEKFGHPAEVESCDCGSCGYDYKVLESELSDPTADLIIPKKDLSDYQRTN